MQRQSGYTGFPPWLALPDLDCTQGMGIWYFSMFMVEFTSAVVAVVGHDDDERILGLIRQKVPDHKIQQMMGARKGRGYLLAALLGAVTPFCSCSTIPMLRGLLSAKAGFGPTLTFLFVSPLLNPIIVGLMWMTFGWKVTLLYAIIAAGVSVLASIILDSAGFERHIIASKLISKLLCSSKNFAGDDIYAHK